MDGGEYIVQNFMEEGGYGSVVRAIKTSTWDRVAIKILKKRSNYDEVVEHEVSNGLRAFQCFGIMYCMTPCLNLSS